ncbi:bifunctional riboflavin kinase/FAD synthetase [Plebeiibacterium marinum]|uniref:Riboflavin biosynthesis protein n=1 Tax=Plebeiibacterium marinum TaxID=2992111 RepID=A0AAE3SJ07_9BACT|nr:bifunctional riboflavin kinase/FAD synthetase [Plebeiobacterium marinum]MCW3805265.1 bifunctional riboflavin kinase/FAD synthetase [Plebeiobacterium marinum]
MKVYSDLDSYNGKATVITIGMFDGVHAGHKSLIKEVTNIGREKDLAPTILTFWPHPRMVLNKGDEKLQFLTTLDEKTRIISQLDIEQLILLPFSKDLASKTAEEFIVDFLINRLKMKHLVVGFNHRFGRDRLADFSVYKKFAEEYGFGITKVNPILNKDAVVSSTAIRNFLSIGNITEANRVLGYQYSIFGTVKGGQQLGRKLGYPTANISPNEHYKLIPAIGVYACKIHVIGKEYGGMLNIGIRPTVSSDSEDLSIEVHILDFNQDVYSEEVLITFVEKIRDEKKFAGIEELKAQLKNDEMKIRKILNM